MSDQSQGPGWWRATDGRWYPPETHPYYESQPPPEQREGWWLARDGYWYPLEVHPDYMPAEVEPAVAVRPDATVTPPGALDNGRADPRASARRPRAWHERTGGRIAVGVTGVFVVLAIVGILTDEDEEPATRVRSNLVQTTVSAVAERTTTLATTTTTSSTTIPTTTTVAATTATTAASSPAATIRVEQQGVSQGSFCSPPGARGVTSAGTAMECRSEGGDQARWRAA